jgi:hypothetical protein
MPKVIHSGRTLVGLPLGMLGAVLLLLSTSAFPSAGWNSVLRLAGIAVLGGGVAYVLILSRDQLHEWQTLIAALINVGAIIFTAIWVTSGLTAAMKRTEVFLDFTKRYNEIRVAAHELDNRVEATPSALEGDAHQIYFRLFGLIYDEVHAYQEGFLEKEVIVDWLSWQMYDYMNGEFKIGGVSYADGWQWWLTTPAQHHQNTSILEKIFKCKERECVKDVIGRVGVRGWLIGDRDDPQAFVTSCAENLTASRNQIDRA